jgi:Flp pilus assembly pilin Flp
LQITFNERRGAALSTLIRLLKDTRGVTTIEYGLIVAGIAVGLIVGFGILGDQVAASYDDINVKIKTAAGPN